MPLWELQMKRIYVNSNQKVWKTNTNSCYLNILRWLRIAKLKLKDIEKDKFKLYWAFLKKTYKYEYACIKIYVTFINDLKQKVCMIYTHDCWEFNRGMISFQLLVEKLEMHLEISHQIYLLLVANLVFELHSFAKQIRWMFYILDRLVAYLIFLLSRLVLQDS